MDKVQKVNNLIKTDKIMYLFKIETYCTTDNKVKNLLTLKHNFKQLSYESVV
jgi:hypothetical protein